MAILILLDFVEAAEALAASNPGGGGVKLVRFGEVGFFVAGGACCCSPPPSLSTMERPFISIL